MAQSVCSSVGGSGNTLAAATRGAVIPNFSYIKVDILCKPEVRSGCSGAIGVAYRLDQVRRLLVGICLPAAKRSETSASQAVSSLRAVEFFKIRSRDQMSERPSAEYRSTQFDRLRSDVDAVVKPRSDSDRLGRVG